MRSIVTAVISPTKNFEPDQKSRLRKFSTARFLSELGTKAAFVAIVLRVTELTPSATVLSAVLAVTVIADSAATPVAGILGDLVDRRRLMIASDISAAFLYAALGFVDNLFLLAVLAMSATACEAFYFPASSASIPNLFDKKNLGVVNSVFSQARTSGAIAGPLIASLMTTRVGAGPVFWLNAATFMVSAFLISRVDGSFKSSDGPTRPVARHVGHVGGFLRVLRENPVVVNFMALWITVQLGTGALWIAIPKLADDIGPQSTTYATLLTASTVGSFLGAFLAARLLAFFTSARVLVWAFIAEAALLLVTGTASALVPALAALAGFRAAEIAGGTASYTLFQSSTEDDVRARASAWIDGATVGAFGAGVALAGPLVDMVGPRYTFATASVSVSMGALLAWRMTKQIARLAPRRPV
jgi:MFS family permease